MKKRRKNLELVWIAQGDLDAQIKKNYLVANGITPILYEESVGESYGFTNTPLGEVEIYVNRKSTKSKGFTRLIYWNNLPVTLDKIYTPPLYLYQLK